MFSVGFLTLDIIIVIALFAIFFFWAIIKGGKQLALLLVSLYISSVIYAHDPFDFSNDSRIQILVFVILTGVIFFLIRKSIKMKRSIGKRPFNIALLSVSLLIVLFTLYYHILPISTFYTFTLPFESFFTSMVPIGVLYAIPIVLLFFVNRGD